MEQSLSKNIEGLISEIQLKLPLHKKFLKHSFSKIRDKEEKPKCFIATAAYGTPFAREIDVLRDFRDKRLLNNYFGVMFVDIYYTLSPSIANIIAKNLFLRKLTRGLLKPVVYFFGKIK